MLKKELNKELIQADAEVLLIHLLCPQLTPSPVASTREVLAARGAQAVPGGFEEVWAQEHQGDRSLRGNEEHDSGW